MNSSGPEYIPWIVFPSRGRCSQRLRQVSGARSSMRSATAETSSWTKRRRMVRAMLLLFLPWAPAPLELGAEDAHRLVVDQREADVAELRAGPLFTELLRLAEQDAGAGVLREAEDPGADRRE